MRVTRRNHPLVDGKEEEVGGRERVLVIRRILMAKEKERDDLHLQDSKASLVVRAGVDLNLLVVFASIRFDQQ